MMGSGQPLNAHFDHVFFQCPPHGYNWNFYIPLNSFLSGSRDTSRTMNVIFSCATPFLVWLPNTFSMPDWEVHTKKICMSWSKKKKNYKRLSASRCTSVNIALQWEFGSKENTVKETCCLFWINKIMFPLEFLK